VPLKFRPVETFLEQSGFMPGGDQLNQFRAKKITLNPGLLAPWNQDELSGFDRVIRFYGQNI
jgi:hypothetical protein